MLFKILIVLWAIWVIGGLIEFVGYCRFEWVKDRAIRRYLQNKVACNHRAARCSLIAEQYDEGLVICPDCHEMVWIKTLERK